MNDDELDQGASLWMETGNITPELYAAMRDRAIRQAHLFARRYNLNDPEEIADVALTNLLMKRCFDPEKGSFSSYLNGYVEKVACNTAHAPDTYALINVDTIYNSMEYKQANHLDFESETDRAVEQLHRAEQLHKRIDIDLLDQQIAEAEGTVYGDPGAGKRWQRRKQRCDLRHRRGNSALFQIRLRAAMTREEMANGMGLPVWMYQAYETGKRETPKWIYDEAKAFAENARPPGHFAWLHQVSGQEVVQRWEHMLGMPWNDPRVVQVCGINPKKLQKWYNEVIAKPDKSPARMARSHETVLVYLESVGVNVDEEYSNDQTWQWP